MRPLRCPRPAGLYEITTRITGNELLLRPSDGVNAIILGVLARAQIRTGIKLHSFVFLSSHYHILLTADDAEQLSEFMQYLNSNIARKLNAHLERRGAFWQRRFRAIAMTEDEATARWRLRYMMAHGVKENLVGSIGDWPGVNALPWLLHAQRLIGVWTDFTARSKARRRKNYVETPGEFETRYPVELTVLPCWRDVEPEYWRKLIHDDILQAQSECDAERIRTGSQPMGVEAVLARDPFSRVVAQKQTRAPSVLALDWDRGGELMQEHRAVREAYTEASERFRSGELTVVFPGGTMRPPSWVPPAGWRRVDGHRRMLAYATQVVAALGAMMAQAA